MASSRQILNDLLLLHKKYSVTYRAITTEERYENLVSSGILTKWSYDSPEIREPLIEHVGHLPIIASYLYQYTKPKVEVDLGRVLIMLSIHDIGETEAGDIISYSKSKDHEELELSYVKKILKPELLNYFDEFEAQETTESKFAKAVDSLAPMLHELLLPKVTVERFKFFNFGPEKIIAKKRKYFEWDATLLEIFDNIIAEYYKILEENK